MIRIGVIGTGFIASGIVGQIEVTRGMSVTGILTRRPIDETVGLPTHLLTNNISELADNCDLVIEATGDAIHGTNMLLGALQAGCPIITANPELHVTTGSYFADKIFITDADGDQPGGLARQDKFARDMGFRPLAYLNLKGFLNLNPSEKDMKYWAKRQKLSLEQTISFTDGSKLQIEQALTANGLDADIAQDGMIGATIEDLSQTGFLADRAKELGRPIADYVLCPGSPPGVLLIAECELAHKRRGNIALNKLLTSDGKYFQLLQPNHLLFLEIIRTINDWKAGLPPLLNNSALPRIGVAAIAKKALKKGHVIKRGLGSFETRGLAVRIAEQPDLVPICLLQNARLKTSIEPDQFLTFQDVILPPSPALDLYMKIRNNVVAHRTALPLEPASQAAQGQSR